MFGSVLALQTWRRWPSRTVLKIFWRGFLFFFFQPTADLPNQPPVRLWNPKTPLVQSSPSLFSVLVAQSGLGSKMVNVMAHATLHVMSSQVHWSGTLYLNWHGECELKEGICTCINNVNFGVKFPRYTFRYITL
jgi:hypothetical protein